MCTPPKEQFLLGKSDANWCKDCKCYCGLSSKKSMIEFYKEHYNMPDASLEKCQEHCRSKSYILYVDYTGSLISIGMTLSLGGYPMHLFCATDFGEDIPSQVESVSSLDKLMDIKSKVRLDKEKDYINRIEKFF